jgi:hypothetical protein
MLVAGAAIFALDASAASGQDTTARARRPVSSRRIPVAKEAASTGEVTVRVDTVMTYRTDTLRLPGRTDTVVTTRTVTRVDTVTQMIPIRVPQIGGFYAGIAVGSALPAANFNNSDHPGWRVEVPLGFDFVNTPWGVRFNGGYANYSPHTWVSGLLDNAQVWNIDGDVKLRIASATPAMLRIQLYGLAGVTYNWYKEILEDNGTVLSIGDSTRNAFILPRVADNSWHSGWGWNTGAGVEVGKSHMNVYVESRFNRWNGVITNISHVPLVIGVNWY